MTREEELARLKDQNTEHHPIPGEIVVAFDVHCAGDADQVLHRAKEVQLTILQENPTDWPSIDEWRQRLPAWFIERSAAEISQAEAERRLTLSFKERSELNRHWSVGAFLFWFMPNERAWFWWDAQTVNPNLFQLRLLVFDLPFAWDSLDWLLRASGAMRVEEV